MNVCSSSRLSVFSLFYSGIVGDERGWESRNRQSIDLEGCIPLHQDFGCRLVRERSIELRLPCWRRLILAATCRRISIRKRLTISLVFVGENLPNFPSSSRIRGAVGFFVLNCACNFILRRACRLLLLLRNNFKNFTTSSKVTRTVMTYL